MQPVLRDHCHERPPVLTDHAFSTEGPTFQYNWTCHQRPPVLTDHSFVANRVVFQDRFHGSHTFQGIWMLNLQITCIYNQRLITVTVNHKGHHSWRRSFMAKSWERATAVSTSTMVKLHVTRNQFIMQLWVFTCALVQVIVFSCTRAAVELVLKDNPTGHKNVVCPDKLSLVTGSVGLKCRSSATNVWFVKTGGLSWQWSLKTGFTVSQSPYWYKVSCRGKIFPYRVHWFGDTLLLYFVQVVNDNHAAPAASFPAHHLCSLQVRNFPYVFIQGHGRTELVINWNHIQVYKIQNTNFFTNILGTVKPALKTMFI